MIESALNNCTNSSFAKVPSERQIDGLQVEICVLIFIYLVTIAFTMYNIVVYLWKQHRYRIWLVTFFYVLAMVVLSARITSYVYSFLLNHMLKEKL